MPKIVVVLAVTFALLGAASPAVAGPGVSGGGPADQDRYARCFAGALASVGDAPALATGRAQRGGHRPDDWAAADAECQPKRPNPAIPLVQAFEAAPGTAGTAIVSCDARHQFSYRGIGFPYRAADPSITGDTTVVTGGPYPYRASAVSTGQVGGYADAYYWRINNTTGVPVALVMSITCQRPDGF